MATPQLTEEQATLLHGLTVKLGTDETTALSKALKLADYIADTDADPNTKLLLEDRGHITRLRLVRNY